MYLKPHCTSYLTDRRLFLMNSKVRWITPGQLVKNWSRSNHSDFARYWHTYYLRGHF